LPRLQHSARGAGRVAAALDLDAVEEGAVGAVVPGVDLGPDEIAGLELHELVGPGAARLDHADGLARAGALERLEDMAGEQPVAGEDDRPEGLRLLVDDLDGVAVELVDARHLLEPGARAGGVGGIDGELPVEDHVVSREGRAVVPGDVALEPPSDRLAVPREAA